MKTNVGVSSPPPRPPRTHIIKTPHASECSLYKGQLSYLKTTEPLSHWPILLHGVAQSVKRQATYWIDGVLFVAWERDFLLLYRVQAGSGVAVSYPIGTGFFHKGKVAEA
jgi:hypothetical protein